jgi:hypothetical protein
LTRISGTIWRHESHTCQYAGLKGLANGELLTAAEQAGYEAFITVDKNMPHEQNLRGRGISVIVLEGRSTAFDDLVPLISEVLIGVDVLQRGQVLRIAFR